MKDFKNLFFQQAATDLYGFSDSTEGTGGGGASTGDQPQLSDNLLKIKVYFDSLNLKTVAEVADYPMWVSPSRLRRKTKQHNLVCCCCYSCMSALFVVVVVVDEVFY